MIVQQLKLAVWKQSKQNVDRASDVNDYRITSTWKQSTIAWIEFGIGIGINSFDNRLVFIRLLNNLYWITIVTMDHFYLKKYLNTIKKYHNFQQISSWEIWYRNWKFATLVSQGRRQDNFSACTASIIRHTNFIWNIIDHFIEWFQFMFLDFWFL